MSNDIVGANPTFLTNLNMENKMNIFFLDTDPKTCAEYHCDKHVVKMILEYAQLLSTSHRELYGDKCSDVLYKSTHKNHPSAIWTRANARHYHWLYNLFYYLCEEYKKRYNKTHLTDTKLSWRLKYTPDKMKIDFFSPPPQCMPDKHKCDDTVQAYRNYYNVDKAYMCKWKNAQQPEWFQDDSGY